jgi:2'-5' RNA ligase
MMAIEKPSEGAAAKERKPRVFIGVKIAADVAQDLVRHAHDLGPHDVRLVAPADVHLTLVPPWNAHSIPEAIDRLRGALGGIGPFPLQLDRLAYGPQLRRPRLLWAKCAASGELSRLHVALHHAFGSTDQRPFRPHVTVARLGEKGGAIFRKHPIDPPLAVQQQITSVELFESPVAGQRGYRVLASVPLGEEADDGAVPAERRPATRADRAIEPGTAPGLEAARPVPIRLFLCGDVMTGRGIDQVLPHPSNPVLHEYHVASALDYVRLAEEANGAIPKPRAFSYVWGAALEELSRAQPDVRIINLETSITRSDEHDPKGINYRMSPENAECLAAAGIDCCALANNHVLDWGQAGFLDTLRSLDRLRIAHAGAGRNHAEAGEPAIIDVSGKGRVVVFAFASTTSGVPRHWAARHERPGVNLLADLSDATIAGVVDEIARVRRPGDVIIASIHWGPNWGYDVPDEQVRFARALIDRAGVSIVHGHSSHHPKGMEAYRNRLILYGCGDFINDYEGIAGYEVFRGDLSLMYFADVDAASGELVALEMVPLRIRRFQLIHASRADTQWLMDTLNQTNREFGARVYLDPEGRLRLSCDGVTAAARQPVRF